MSVIPAQAGTHLRTCSSPLTRDKKNFRGDAKAQRRGGRKEQIFSVRHPREGGDPSEDVLAPLTQEQGVVPQSDCAWHAISSLLSCAPRRRAVARCFFLPWMDSRTGRMDPRLRGDDGQCRGDDDSAARPTDSAAGKTQYRGTTGSVGSLHNRTKRHVDAEHLRRGDHAFQQLAEVRMLEARADVLPAVGHEQRVSDDLLFAD